MTHSQLVHNFDWRELCSEAGLEPPTTSRDAGVPQADAVEMFLVEMGYLPSGIQPLARFAKEKGFGLGYRSGGKVQRDIRPALEEVRRRWAAMGRWCPSSPLKPADAPPWRVDPFTVEEVPARRKRKTSWTLVECEASLNAAISEP